MSNRRKPGPEYNLPPEIVAQLCTWGAQAKSIAEWARKLGVSCNCVYDAIARGSGRLTRNERTKFRRAGINPDTVQL